MTDSYPYRTVQDCITLNAIRHMKRALAMLLMVTSIMLMVRMRKLIGTLREQPCLIGKVG
jgi:hypothetical protein